MKNLFIIAIIGLSLIGCANFYDFKVKNPQSYQAPKVFLENFMLSGRFLITTAKTKHYGNYTWFHSVTTDRFLLQNPLGQNLAQINFESNNKTLIIANHTYSDIEFNQMMEENLGGDLPLNFLVYWVQGLADPKEKSISLIDGFEQAGWAVEYLLWQPNNSISSKPKLIKCSNSKLNLKLVLNWNN